jgi:hypothetical protein
MLQAVIRIAFVTPGDVIQFWDVTKPQSKFLQTIPAYNTIVILFLEFNNLVLHNKIVLKEQTCAWSTTAVLQIMLVRMFRLQVALMVKLKQLLMLAEISFLINVVLPLQEIHTVFTTLVTQTLETVSETTLANVYKIVIVMTALDVLSTNVSATTLAKQQILIATPFSQTELVL